jgi:GDP-L-fucose synthase
MRRKQLGAPHVTLWGSGSPRREFLFADDLAEACVHLMQTYTGRETVNIGTGEDISIRELAELIRSIIGFSGEIQWDASMPDGTPRKLLDVSKVHGLGWKHRIALEEGIRMAYRDFLAKDA